jgi:hypothetical protein
MRRITLTLDEETLRDAHVLAAKRGLSVSAFLRNQLSGLVERHSGFTTAREAAIRRLHGGQSRGGGKLANRHELRGRSRLR